MKKIITDLLCCPNCLKDLILINSIEESDEIRSGDLVCNQCNRKYAIKEFIPRFIELNKNNCFEAGDEKNKGWNPDLFSKFLTKFQIDNAYKFSQNDQTKFSLDIGCGERGIGTVNCDIYIPQNIPQNFILASAEALPFKSRSFDIVFSRYVIEHLIDPAKFIQKQMEIAKEKVICITDNSEWIGEKWFRLINTGRIFHKDHCYKWSVEYLDNLIRRLDYRGKTELRSFSTSLLVHFFSRLGWGKLKNFVSRDLLVEIKNYDYGK